MTLYPPSLQLLQQKTWLKNKKLITFKKLKKFQIHRFNLFNKIIYNFGIQIQFCRMIKREAESKLVNYRWLKPTEQATQSFPGFSPTSICLKEFSSEEYCNIC